MITIGIVLAGVMVGSFWQHARPHCACGLRLPLLARDRASWCRIAGRWCCPFCARMVNARSWLP